MPEGVKADKPPVFIVGCPRSGTTLLRNILNRHPVLAVCGETRFFAEIYSRRRAFGALENPENRRHLVDQYVITARARRLGLDANGLRDRLLKDATNYQAFFTATLQYHAESQGKTRFGEKTPHHSFFTERLSNWYPGAAIIHLVRDPRAAVASLLRFPLTPNDAVSNAWLWRVFNRAAARASHQPGYLRVHYERLVECPEPELARICAHLGEDYAPSMLAAGETSGGDYAWPRSAFGAITRGRMNLWSEQLASTEVSLIEDITRRDMDLYGYARTSRSVTLPVAARGLALAAWDAVRRTVREPRYTWSCLAHPCNLAEQEYWRYRNAWNIVFPGIEPLRHGAK